jgi:outer membrane protein assembly factor BamB
VWALSEENGKELWEMPLGAAYQQGPSQSKEGPSCTPTVDGDRLYVLGMGGSLACLQVADGKIVWQKSLTKDFGGHIPTWSYRESPLVDGEKLICTPGAEDATFMALNKMTGEVIWKSKMPDREGQGSSGNAARGRGRGRGAGGAAYASAIAIDADGQRQYVQMTATALVGIAASDGKFLWRYDKAANGNGINCTTPLFFDGMVFAASAYGAGGGLVKLTKDDNGAAKAEEVWFSKRMQNHHGGIILFDGCLYGANGGLEGGALICLDSKTGDVLWDEHGKRRALKGSIALADGRLYYRTEDGTLLLIEPSRKEYIERGRVEQPDRSSSPAWSHPVIANGKLYVRDQDLLFCYDISAK